MGNKLYQQAKKAVYEAETAVNNAATPEECDNAQTEINKAKNSISSAFANSNFAEQHQLQELQERLDQAQTIVNPKQVQ